MSVNNRKTNILLALAALLVASLACNLPARQSQETSAPPVPVTTEAVENFKDNLDAAATEVAQSGQVSVVITEEQLTSLVAFEVQSQSDPILEDPQVYLRNGKVEVHGRVQQRGVSAPLKAILNIGVDGQGQPRYEIESANLGPFPLPQSVLDQLSAQLDQAFASQFSAEAENMVIEDISIGDGVMTVTGHTK